MKRVYKWKLGDETTILIQEGAQILHVREQYGEPTLWALVDPSAGMEERYFKIYGTGHEIPDNPGTYTGTFCTNSGDLVFHVFEVTK